MEGDGRTTHEEVAGCCSGGFGRCGVRGAIVEVSPAGCAGARGHAVVCLGTVDLRLHKPAVRASRHGNRQARAGEAAARAAACQRARLRRARMRPVRVSEEKRRRQRRRQWLQRRLAGGSSKSLPRGRLRSALRGMMAVRRDAAGTPGTRDFARRLSGWCLGGEAGEGASPAAGPDGTVL